MVKKQQGEVWREVICSEGKPIKRYAVSNTGRLASFKTEIEDGNILKGNLIEGFPAMEFTINKRKKVQLLHRVILEAFGFPQPDPSYRVIHLDFKKTNNRLSNLKWASKDEWHAHQNRNPTVLASRAISNSVRMHRGQKLSVNQVALLKKKLLDPNRKTRIRLLAKQHGVTEMTLYRIKSGENWSHVPPAP